MFVESTECVSERRKLKHAHILVGFESPRLGNPTRHERSASSLRHRQKRMWLESMPMLHAGQTTRVDGCEVRNGRSWDVDGAIVHLRPPGSNEVHSLPSPPRPIKIGSSTLCDLQLRDETRTLSREHALLFPTSNGWTIQDLDSSNGIKVDHVIAKTCLVESGSHIRLGRLSLIAEGPGFIRLRALMCRIVGWSDPVVVDDALHCLREYVARKAILVLVGDDDLASTASRLHCESVGRRIPFHICNDGDVEAAFATVGHGTLVVPAHGRVPVSAFVKKAHMVPDSERPRIVVYTSHARLRQAIDNIYTTRLAMIDIPPLSARTDDRLALVDALAAERAKDLGFASPLFNAMDPEILSSLKHSDIEDLEDSVHRVVLLRHCGVVAASRRLGVTHSTLSQWAKYRGLST